MTNTPLHDSHRKMSSNVLGKTSNFVRWNVYDAIAVRVSFNFANAILKRMKNDKNTRF